MTIGLTATFVSAEDPTGKDPLVGVDDLTYRIGVRPSAHGVDVHFVKLAHFVKEDLKTGPESNLSDTASDELLSTHLGLV